MLDAQTQAIAAVAPGVPYRDIHELACRVMVEGMKSLGFMRGDAAEAVQAGAHAIFFQCGTGHMMGLDVHDMEGLGENDVGYGEGYRAQHAVRPQVAAPGAAAAAGLRRHDRAGHLHQPLAHASAGRPRAATRSFIDYAMFDKHAGFGGIRIEDDILVTADGRRELGPPIARSRADVEAACAG